MALPAEMRAVAQNASRPDRRTHEIAGSPVTSAKSIGVVRPMLSTSRKKSAFSPAIGPRGEFGCAVRTRGYSHQSRPGGTCLYASIGVNRAGHGLAVMCERDARMKEGHVIDNFGKKSGSVPPLSDGLTGDERRSLSPAGLLSSQFDVRQLVQPKHLDAYVGFNWGLVTADQACNRSAQVSGNA